MAVVLPEEAAAMFARNPELLGRAGGAEAFDKVKTALNATTAAHQATAKIAPKETSAATAKAPSSRPTLDGLNDARRSLDQLAPGHIPARSGVVSRLVIAFFAGIFVLELISQMTGQYFKWNLGNVLPNAHGALKYVGFYPGQVQKIAPAPPSPGAHSQTP